MVVGCGAGPDAAQVPPVPGLTGPMCSGGPSLRTRTLRTGTVSHGRSRRRFRRALDRMFGSQSRWALRAAPRGVRAAPSFLLQSDHGALHDFSLKRQGDAGPGRSGPLGRYCMGPRNFWISAPTQRRSAPGPPSCAGQRPFSTTVAGGEPQCTGSSPSVQEQWAAGFPSELHQLPNHSWAVRPFRDEAIGGRPGEFALPRHATRPCGVVLGSELGQKCVRDIREVRMSRIGTDPPASK